MTKEQTFFNVIELPNNEARIDIYGEVVPDDWRASDVDTSAVSFRNAIKDLGEVDTLNVHINSPGGSVYDGVAIFNMLRQHKASVTVHIDGLAASIASVIAMSGDKIVMPSNSMMMIHNAMSVSIGNANDMRKMADDLEKINESVINSYIAKNPELDREYLKALMDDETWLTASEAYELGLVDVIDEPVAAVASIDKEQVNRFKNVPKMLKEMVETPKDTNDNTDKESYEELKNKYDELLKQVNNEKPKQIRYL
ncbi:head maturation protease, ClpP-related [Mammaliicoccus sciuri]|uniref:head maturation protease, ClpP-related n=1 Tax=Mammaliicoccus sciuri TaxID=1296 RepID=UPI002DBCF74B|nr:head maturation protease, ClpP-related [Mammaliicoccus sciuri]MEB8131548.1 Clp protease ClpP [Mammaliicoccus sciuri]